MATIEVAARTRGAGKGTGPAGARVAGGCSIRELPRSERPRWERVTEFATNLWGQPVTGLFFINATQGQLPLPFVQALLALKYRVVPLAGEPDEKVVDISHDADFAPHVQRLDTDGRRVGVIAFPEFTSGQFTTLGVTVYDLESDVQAFNTTLPRVRVIPLASFDPEDFLR